MINAFVHNKWVEGNEPMISVFSDRIEILSRGTIPAGQTIDGFFAGESVPVNQKLSEIFLQLHISEKTGRGVPKVVEKYGKSAYEFRENTIRVTIPFRWVHVVEEENVSGKTTSQNGNLYENEGLNQKSDQKIIKWPEKWPEKCQQIYDSISQDSNITIAKLEQILGIGHTTLKKMLSEMQSEGFIQHIGPDKGGHWEIITADETAEDK